MIDEERAARVWLARAAEPGSAELHRYIDTAGAAVAAHQLRRGTAPPRVQALIGARAGVDRVAEDLELTVRHGLRVIFPGEPEWPDYPLLPMAVATGRGASDLAPPVMLWLRGAGSLATLAERAVAVVGSRAATPYGTHVARELGYDLGQRGWSVVSGGAFGIDAAAHRGALAGDGTTVAVIAGGLDVPYPAGNARLFDQIAEAGVLVSEWPPGSTPQRHRFLLRNRLIAGLGCATVVVEAGRRSGAKHTARRSGELGRPVLVVPGPVTSALSVGCHDLARDGARLVTSAADVLADAGPLDARAGEPPRAPSSARDDLGPAARRVLDGFPARGSSTVEEIARDAGVGLGTVLRCLPELEAAEFVAATDGRWQLRRQRRGPSR